MFKGYTKLLSLSTAALMMVWSHVAAAGEVEIVYANLKSEGNGKWRIAVTLRHQDTGREHFADSWRVVGEDGKVIATRKLGHPHVDEQPFTRALSGVKISPEVRYVYIEAHDNVHGWSSDRLEVELDRTGPRFEAR